MRCMQSELMLKALSQNFSFGYLFPGPKRTTSPPLMMNHVFSLTISITVIMLYGIMKIALDSRFVTAIRDYNDAAINQKIMRYSQISMLNLSH